MKSKPSFEFRMFNHLLLGKPRKKIWSQSQQMNKLTRTVGKAKAIQLSARSDHSQTQKGNKPRCHLAKLRGVLDPKREPTIPFSTKLGPVPVRVPTLIGSPWSHCFLKLFLEMKIEIGPLSLC